MVTPNVRGAYELLRRAMQQQSLQQQGADFGSTPNAAPDDSSDSYGSPQGGLLGRLLALQAEQSRQQPFAGNNGPTSSEALDPNFRQLSRAPVATRPQGAIGASDPPHVQSSPAYSPFGGGTSLDLPSASGQAAGLLGAYGNKPISPWIATPLMMRPVPVGWGRGIPFPPVSPGPLPQIPMPATPDWWETARKVLQIYPSILSGIGGDGGDDLRRCVKAAQQGTMQWENFCRSLPPGQSRAICWTKTKELEQEKKGWCEDEFGAE